jgi:hypothetical protein
MRFGCSARGRRGARRRIAPQGAGGGSLDPSPGAR